MTEKNALDWEIGKEKAFMTIGFAFVRDLARAVYEQAPDLADMFPFKGRWTLHGYLAEDWLAIRIKDDLLGGGVPTAKEMEEDEIFELLQKVSPFKVRSHQHLVALLGEQWFSFNCFTYVGPYNQPFASWSHFGEHYAEWVNSIVVPEVMIRNQSRVLRAIPPAPSFDLNRINQALWVLESDESMTQGTAFCTSDGRLITCEHVIGENTQAFRPNNPSRKYKVNVVKSNKVLDLAVISIGVSLEQGLDIGTSDNLKQMDHIAIAGFPNYRLGDSGIIIPGLVVGFRMISAIRRILTNAAIIEGNSGGPVLDRNNTVIGIAVTGSESMQKSQQTEHHGVIPIDALTLLGI